MTSRLAHPEVKLTAAILENHVDTVALIDANQKLIYREEAAQVGMNKVEFYDSRADRREAENIV